MEPQQHPLLTSTVLRHIFTLAPLTFQDFKNARLVCHFWYEETLSLWRKSVVLTLREASSGIGIDPNSLVAEIQKESILSLEKKPYDKYKLCDMTLDFREMENSVGESAFWIVVGPCVRSLTLYNIKWTHFPRIRLSPRRYRFFQFLRERVPHLGHLGLNSVKLPRDKFLRKPAKEIGLPGLTSLSLTRTKEFYLSDFPNLKTLRLTEGADFLTSELRGDEELPVVNSSVTRLELGWVYNDNNVFTVRFAGLKHLEMVMKDKPSEDVEWERPRNNFLAAHVSHLERCNLIQWKLSFRPTETPFTTELPKLTEVRLWGNVVPELSFLRYTPNLNLLHVDVLNFAGQLQIRNLMAHNRRLEHTSARQVERDLVEGAVAKDVMIGVTLPHLTRLFLSCKLSPESVRALGEWMPNVKEFKAVLNPSTFSIVLEQWGALTSVHCLIGTRLKDTDLTPIIPLMKNLQSFRYDSVCGNSGFDNAEVFLDLHGLNSLTLCVSEQFSEGTETRLGENIQIVKIYRNYSGNPQHHNWKCCRFSEYKVEYLRHILKTTWTYRQSPLVGSKDPLID